MEFDLELVSAYCDEASDLLERWEMIALDLNKGATSDLYQELFRIAHNLKGGSRAVGLSAYGEFVHHVEDGITLLRDGKVPLTPDVVGMLLGAQKILMDWTKEVRNKPDHFVETNDFLAQFDLAMTGSVNEESHSKADEIPSAKAFDSQEATALQSASSFGAQTSEPTASPQVIPTKLNPSKTPAASATKKGQQISANDTLRISALKLDQLLQVIGELSIHQSIVWHTKSDLGNQQQMFLNSIQLAQKLTRELYDKALSLRMQPLQSLFQRLERNIVDIARAINKEVDVVLEGSDVELDKTVIEKIVDPLMHIVRNAIDHGIENAADRLAKGKRERGQVTIKAKQDTFGIELTVQDDGKGLIVDKIRNKALEKGLISSNDTLDRQTILNLIFLPGFSTAEVVTDISGRGVGMDVVRRTLEDLHGQVRIDSEEGVGTSFNITLPTSVSIIDAMLIKLNGQSFVLPMGAVDEVITLQEPLPMGQTMLQHSDKVLPIEDLYTLMATKTRFHGSTPAPTARNTILVCNTRGNRIGFLIEKVMGQQQVVIRQLNENIGGTFGFMGGTILGNGEPGLILDIPALADHYVNRIQPARSAS